MSETSQPTEPYAIPRGSFRYRENVAADFVAVIPPTVGFDQIHRNLTLLVNVTDQLAFGDGVTLLTSDQRLIYLCTCIKGSRDKVGPAVLHVLKVVKALGVADEEDGQQIPAPPGYGLRPATVGDPMPHYQGSWIAYRKSDNLIMNVSPLLTRDEALMFLRNHPAVSTPAPASYNYG